MTREAAAIAQVTFRDDCREQSFLRLCAPVEAAVDRQYEELVLRHTAARGFLTVFGFHGCDRRVADAVLAGKAKLSASANTYDWLGRGIYFWEHGPARALEWAEQQARRKGSKIEDPYVIGALIQLGNCFDLLDVRFTDELAATARELELELTAIGQSLPENQRTGTGDYDWLRRDRDCFILNHTIPAIERTEGRIFHTVRGVFQEGEAAFKGAGIKRKSHIQVAVRDPHAVIGYFLPEGL